MKKLIFIMLSLGLFLVNANAAVIGVYSYAAKSKGGDLPGQWEYLYNSNYVIFNSQSGYWVTKAEHEGDTYLATVVLADSFNDITNKPIVGTGSGDADLLIQTQNTYINGYPAKNFYYFNAGNTNGLYKSFYSYDNSVLSSMDRFLTYP